MLRPHLAVNELETPLSLWMFYFESVHQMLAQLVLDNGPECAYSHECLLPPGGQREELHTPATHLLPLRDHVPKLWEGGERSVSFFCSWAWKTEYEHDVHTHALFASRLAIPSYNLYVPPSVSSSLCARPAFIVVDPYHVTPTTISRVYGSMWRMWLFLWGGGIIQKTYESEHGNVLK